MNEVDLKERIEGLIEYVELEGHSTEGRIIVRARASGYLSCAFENNLITKAQHDSYMDRLYGF